MKHNSYFSNETKVGYLTDSIYIYNIYVCQLINVFSKKGI